MPTDATEDMIMNNGMEPEQTTTRRRRPVTEGDHVRCVEDRRPAAMLTVEEVAAILKCSPRTVYRLADAGKVPPPCRLGALVRWPANVVQSWISEGCPAASGQRKRR